jgi:gas vesicle protein
MSDNENDLDIGAFLLGTILGGLVGAALGLLFAPQSGEATRELIRDKGIEIRDKVGETAAAARARAEELARDAKTKAEDLQRRGQVVLEEQKARLDAAVEAAKAPPQVKRS